MEFVQLHNMKVRTYFETLDEITYNLEDEGILLRKELSKTLVTKGGVWATFVYLFQVWHKTKKEYAEPRIALVKYKNHPEGWRRAHYFNIGSVKAAMNVLGALTELKKHLEDYEKKKQKKETIS